MIYGTSYEGTTRECESCGHITTEHADCKNSHCEKPFCVQCGHDENYCSLECRQYVCEHTVLDYELFDDVCDTYVNYSEQWTCRDCGLKFDAEPNPEQVGRKPVRRAGRRIRRAA